MTQEELQNVLELHKKWVNDEEAGERADLSGADLAGVDLSFVDLSNACLYHANLTGANLTGANLTGADLIGACLRDANLFVACLRGTNLLEINLSGANLRGADFSCAELAGANLSGACLRRAYLSSADLAGANLSGACLRDASLYYANLTGADLSGVDITGADIFRADLTNARNIPHITLACPAEGSFVGWKKVNDWLIKLEIPEDAKRSSATTNKCRCDKAKVLEITDLYGNNPVERVTNNAYTECVYIVGQMVYPDSFDEDRWNECSHGIHFFASKEDAIKYY